jgi:senataxin
LSNFWTDFANWEKTIILACMKDKRLISASKSSSTLSDIPPAVLCHVFTSLDVFLNPEILKVVRSTIPVSPSIILPIDPYPPGLLLLAFDEEENSRTWARIHLRVAPQLTKDQLTGHYLKALESVAAALSDQPPPLSFPFSKDPAVLWSGFGLMLRSIPPEYYTTVHGRRLEFNRIVLGHVHDNGQR